MPADPNSRLPAPREPLPSHNPYAPPRVVGESFPCEVDEDSRVDVRAFSAPKLKWTYLVVAVVLHAAIVPGILIGPRPLGSWSSILVLVFALGDKILGVWWLHEAWAARPFPHAHRDVSAAGAVGRLLIPFYGFFYWMFVATVELGASLQPEPSLGFHRARHDASNLKTLAIAACCLQVVGSVGGTLLAASNSPIARAFIVLFSVLRSAAWFGLMATWEAGRRRSLAARLEVMR